jgi:hypothetical protein
MNPAAQLEQAARRCESSAGSENLLAGGQPPAQHEELADVAHDAILQSPEALM